MDKAAENTLVGQLRWLMFFRVVTSTFLLGTTIVVQWREIGSADDAVLTALYMLIAATYFLTVVYALALPRFLPPKVQAYFQVAGDIVITTVVIYMTGGVESIFSFMYILTIINAGILLKMRGGMLAASMATIFYGTLLDLHYYHYIQPYLTRFTFTVFFRAADVLNKLLVNTGAFYLVAFLTGYLSTQAEESRLKLAAKESILARLERLNESIVENIESGLMTLGPAGEILSLNPSGERIIGMKLERVQGKPYSYVFPDLELPAESLLETGESPVWTMRFRHPGGQSLFLDLTLQGLRDSEGPNWGRLLVIRDNTRMRQMEEEVKRVEKLAVVGELAAGIAHEIRNPLASLSGSCQMLEDELGEGEVPRRLMKIIRREIDHLSHIVNDFLMFARPRSAVQERVDLSRAVEETLRSFESQADLNSGLRLVRDIRPGVAVFFAPHQFEQVLWNLLRNGAEAMPEGGVLTVRVGKDSAVTGMGVVTIQDTGQGISPEDKDRIFDPFFTTKERGSGLGLSIVYRILEAGGGRVSVASQPGQGSLFQVFLPLADGD